MRARTSASGRVFSTWRGSTQPRRAVAMPSSIWRSSSSARWQSLSMATRGAGGDRAARERAVQVEVRRRAVDLDDRAGLDGHREQPVVVEIVARPVRHQPVGRVRDERDQRMLHRREIALQQLVGRVAGALVQRRQHDVEPLEDRVREVEPAVGQDVDLAAVQDRDLRIPLAQARDLVGLAF